MKKRPIISLPEKPPVRIQLRRQAGFNLQAHSLALNGRMAVNCARPSPFGNPFVVGVDNMTAEHACIHFRAQLKRNGWFIYKRKVSIEEVRLKLRGKTWPASVRCHRRTAMSTFFWRRQMAIECVAAVINARKAPFSGGTLVVLLAMANYADPDGSNIFPSLARLARQCRMSERNVQNCIDRLLDNGLVALVEHSGSRRGVYNQYSISMDQLRELEGCMACGGVVCEEKGCPDQAKSFRVNRRNPRQDHPKNATASPEKSSSAYRKTRHRPVIDTSAPESPRAPERRGDPSLWEKIDLKLGEEAVTKLEAFGATPAADGDRVVVHFERYFAERFVIGYKRAIQAAVDLPVVFSFAGRESHL